MNLAEQVAAIRAMRHALTSAEEQLHAQLRAMSAQTGATTLKTPYGRVNVVRKDGAPQVDTDLLLAWVQERYPDEIVLTPAVRSSFRAALLAELQPAGDSMVGPGGEIVDWARPGTPTEYVSVTVPAATKQQVVEQVAARLGEVLAAGVLEVAG